ncbi:MAG: LamG-like jellyroll fold domain-containing protein, partial [Planctomycetota bacterium]
TASISDDTRLGPSYTIEAWILPTQLAGWNRLVLNWGAAPEYAYHVGIHNGLASLYHGHADGQYVFAEGGSVQPDRWQHLAAVAKRNDADPGRSTLTVYLNGRQVATGTFEGTIGGAKNDTLGIGDSPQIPSPGIRYRGYLDDLAIWSRALSTEEIRAHCEPRAELLRQQEIARRAEVVAAMEPFGFEEIVFAQRGYGRDLSGHYYANFGYACIDPNVWLHADDGGKLSKLNIRTGEATDLVDDPGGSIRDPQVHYDATKILFSYRKGGTHRYHLYEINVDGTGLRQITDGPWDDIEPTYLPDGDLLFCSTRCHRWIGCWLAETAILFRCDANGESVRMLSSGSFTENTPAVLPDGRVLYTRWEYVNRDPVSFHHLWTMNPDGTGQMVYFGNMHPGGVFIDAKPIPATNDVVLTNSPGHGRNEHQGFVATLSTKQGPNDRASMKNVSSTYDYRDPHPLSEDAFLVARGGQLLLMNAAGDAEVLYAGGSLPLNEPRPIVTRARERIVPPRSDFAKPTATLLVGDVYSGRNMAGVKRGAIKKLLVMEDLPKPANFHGGGSQPIGHGVTSTLKRILGTVPVAPDGSACFEVPAMRSIYFALLDENDRSVKQMRSFVTLQPGETAGCVGCHEPREKTSAALPGIGLQAVAREPSKIEPIAEAPEIMDFPRDVQPILDRHCVRCHNHERRDGGVALTGDHGPVFSQSYYSLYLYWQIKDTGGQPQHGTGREPGNNEPYATYSSASPLMDKLAPSHYEVDLSPHERRLVQLWIDVGATYPGTYAAYGTGQVGGCWRVNEPIRVMADEWPSTAPAVEAVARRCAACHPKEQLPQHVTAVTALNPWGDMLSWTRPLSRYSRHRVYNLSGPEKSLFLLAPLARQAGGYAEGKPVAEIEDPKPVPEDQGRPPQPIEHPIVFADTHDPDYRKILAHIEEARAKLGEIKRFDMPGFKPNEHYVREMKRYGVLPASFDLGKDPIDVYATDDAYFRSFWHVPRAGEEVHAAPARE